MIDKIKKITYQIEKIYHSLSDLEIQNDSNRYVEKIEELKMYLELENNYYEKLKQELRNSKKMKNLVLEEVEGKFEFDFEGMDPLAHFYCIEDSIIHKDKRNLIERRIYNHIITIFNEIEDSKVLSMCLSDEQIITLNKKKDFVFFLDNDEVFIYDRSKALIQMLEKASIEFYLNYLYLLQAKIEDKEIFYQNYIRHKYDLFFISPNLEKIGICDYFSISYDSIRNLKMSNQNPLEEKIIAYQLESISTDIFLELEESLLHYNDIDFSDKNPHRDIVYYYFTLERLLWQTSTITIDEEVLLEHINELLLTDNINNEKVRKSLVKQIKN